MVSSSSRPARLAALEKSASIPLLTTQTDRDTTSPDVTPSRDTNPFPVVPVWTFMHSIGRVLLEWYQGEPMGGREAKLVWLRTVFVAVGLFLLSKILG